MEPTHVRRLRALRILEKHVDTAPQDPWCLRGRFDIRREKVRIGVEAVASFLLVAVVFTAVLAAWLCREQVAPDGWRWPAAMALGTAGLWLLRRLGRGR